MIELNQALGELDKDPQIGAIVLTGSEKAFAGMYLGRAEGHAFDTNHCSGS
jgi:enoyl-CoA hydratase/carnithine racemase